MGMRGRYSTRKEMKGRNIETWFEEGKWVIYKGEGSEVEVQQASLSARSS